MRIRSDQRCFNHAQREAAARCPECGRFFCRECVAEHDDRVICAACLKQLSAPPRQRSPFWPGALLAGQCVLALLLAWFFFFFIGDWLLRLPASFHEATLWQVLWVDQS